MKKNYKEWDYTLILVGLVLLIAVLTSSCARSMTVCEYTTKKMCGHR